MTTAKRAPSRCPAAAVFGVVVCLATTTLPGGWPEAVAASGQPKGIAQQVYAVSGEVSDVDIVGRMVTIKSGNTLSAPIYAGPTLPIFNELRRGDIVTIQYYDAYIVEVTPGERMKPLENTTAEAQDKVTRPDAGVLQQTKLVVTVDAVDAATGMVTYHGFDNRRVQRMVQHRQLLDGLKVGDVVTVTFTRAQAVSIKKQ